MKSKSCHSASKKFTFGLILLFSTIIFTPSVKAQGAIRTGAEVIKGVYTAAKFTHDNWTKIKWIWGGMNHRWWACIYNDGFITYNDFRSYRTSMDAYNYFVKGRGDCDAIYDFNNPKKICYENPMQAKLYTDQHGPIRDIQYVGDDGRYHSVFDY